MVRFAEILMARSDEVIDLIVAEVGKTRLEALGTEVVIVADLARYFAKRAPEILAPKSIPLHLLKHRASYLHYVPRGVVGIIAPWNFPFSIPMGETVMALIAGNAVVLKPSEVTPLIALKAQELMIAAGIPGDLFDVATGRGAVGAALVDSGIDYCVFTGSVATGKKVAAACGERLIPCTLELGGKAPAIVCEDFPLRLAAERTLFVKYLNAGQICTTVDHLWLPHASIEAYVAMAKEIVPKRYPSIASPDYTSIIDERAFDRLLGALDDARARGATLVQLVPGPAHDSATRKIAPHIVLGAPPDSLLWTREIFGPILPIRGYSQLSEVVNTINAGDRPLAIYPFSYHRATVQHILDHVMSGGVSVNDALFHVGQHDLPFGGVGASGMGYYHGREGFDTFSKLRPVFYQARFSTLTFIMPPYGKFADRVLAFMTQ